MDIHFIRHNAEKVTENESKRFRKFDFVKEILAIDEKWRSILFKIESMNKTKNKLKKCFKSAPVTMSININDSYTMDNLLSNISSGILLPDILTEQQIRLFSNHIDKIIKELEEECVVLLQDRDGLILKIGNILHPDVVLSKDEADNKIIYETGIPPELSDKKYNHVTLGEKLEFVDTKNGHLVCGNRGYFLTGMGVRLNQALINYALEFLEQKEYKLMSTPHTVTMDLMSKITQLEEWSETLYRLEGYNNLMIATSEQPLTGYFANKHLTKSELPIKFGGLSTCYRKETGRHNNMGGIYRVHQFEKIEQFCVTEPDKSWDMFHQMINTSKEFYDSLGIKYRVISIVSGELNNAAAMKYDLEAWFPGSKFYGELVSCTNCLDYFSQRINTKIQNTKEYVHMLNCTLMANTRVISCLMETYQTEDGMQIPKVLQKYIGCEKIMFKT